MLCKIYCISDSHLSIDKLPYLLIASPELMPPPFKLMPHALSLELMPPLK